MAMFGEDFGLSRMHLSAGLGLMATSGDDSGFCRTDFPVLNVNFWMTGWAFVFYVFFSGHYCSGPC